MIKKAFARFGDFTNVGDNNFGIMITANLVDENGEQYGQVSDVSIPITALDTAQLVQLRGTTAVRTAFNMPLLVVEWLNSNGIL